MPEASRPDQQVAPPALVAELVALRPDVIVAGSPPNALAVHNAAPMIPLVFVGVADPVGLGLVKSLAHPGGTATGFATLVPAGEVLFLSAEGLTVTTGGEPCFGCAGSPTSFWSYRPSA